jgi:hypothetical protein
MPELDISDDLASADGGETVTIIQAGMSVAANEGASFALLAGQHRGV